MVKVHSKNAAIAGEQMAKWIHRIYDYQIYCGYLQCRLCETPKKHLYKRFIIRLKMLQCGIGIKCLKLLIELKVGEKNKTTESYK